MRRSEAFPSKYIGKDDLHNPLLVTIKEVSTAMIKGDHGDECKTVMFFKEPNIKPLIINSCNWMTLEDAYGEESDDWHGKPVELYVDPNVMFAGKRVGGVRVRVAPLQQFPQQTKPTGVNAMSLSQAVEACKEAGISQDTLVESLKAQGHEAYNSVRDTPHVLQIIDNVKNRSLVPDIDEDIPF